MRNDDPFLIRRRQLLKAATLAAVAGPSSHLLSALGHTAALGQTAAPVERVLVVFKCHLDVGFTATQSAVMRRYFDVYYPAAIQMGGAMRAAGGDRYIWTTGSWLLYEYLEQASAVQRKVMEQAIAAGDITYHALPFSWQTEMIDRTMIAGGLGFAAALDARFGRRTIAAKMTDVPGHSRGIIAPLQDAGVELLDVGVNAASTPPEVPDVFLWKDSGGRSVVMLYHRHDYGSVLRIPGSSVAVSVEVRNDNSGPHTPAEVTEIFARLRSQFPGAHVQAATFNDVADAVRPFRAQLPVVKGEIGDTWIYGCASDPLKVARYREVAQLRRAWLAAGRFRVGDATDRELLRHLLLAVEHTWGTDTKSFLDNDHYRPAELNAVLGQPGYTTMLTSWKEKRDDITVAVATLPKPMQDEAGRRLETLVPVRPKTKGMAKLDHLSVAAKHYTLAIDPGTGAITQMLRHSTGQDWASASAPLALFSYQVLSAEEYVAYREAYLKSKADWAPRDFGKPGIERYGIHARQWHPVLKQAWSAHDAKGVKVILRLEIEDPTALATGNVAWPAEIYLEIELPDAKPVVHLRQMTFGKQANRLPEAMWLSFGVANGATHRCTVEKCGERVDLNDVLEGGGRAMHAVDNVRIERTGVSSALQIATLDAPVVAFGERSPLNFSRSLPRLGDGIHVSLYNNAWGTNYPQWGEGDWAYRFTLTT